MASNYDLGSNSDYFAFQFKSVNEMLQYMLENQEELDNQLSLASDRDGRKMQNRMARHIDEHAKEYHTKMASEGKHGIFEIHDDCSCHTVSNVRKHLRGAISTNWIEFGTFLQRTYRIEKKSKKACKIEGVIASVYMFIIEANFHPTQSEDAEDLSKIITPRVSEQESLPETLHCLLHEIDEFKSLPDEKNKIPLYRKIDTMLNLLLEICHGTGEENIKTGSDLLKRSSKLKEEADHLRKQVNDLESSNCVDIELKNDEISELTARTTENELKLRKEINELKSTICDKSEKIIQLTNDAEYTKQEHTQVLHQNMKLITEQSTHLERYATQLSKYEPNQHVDESVRKTRRKTKSQESSLCKLM